MKLSPVRRLVGRIDLPGDKSISHRAAIIAALACGDSRLENFSSSQDCAATLACLERLGATIARSGNSIEIAGMAGKFWRPQAPLDCHNSGTTMRLLAGVLAAQKFSSILVGDASLSARPMQRVIEPLTMMGAQINSSAGRPPLEIAGDQLRAVSYELPVASAQVKSSILLAGLAAKGETEVFEPTKTRDHTERLMRHFGINVRSVAQGQGSRISVSGPATPVGKSVRIPGDLSSAAFFIAGAVLLPDSQLEIQNVGLNPTRTQFLETLKSLGADLQWTIEGEEANEPFGSVRIHGSSLASSPSPYELSGELVPLLIDELPLLAVVGSQTAGGVVVRHATELRFKESDRVTATITNLRAMGAEVEEFSDGFRIAGGQRLRGAGLVSYGDHRIAMAFSVAALLADGDSELDDAECVGVSFPEFFKLLESVAEK